MANYRWLLFVCAFLVGLIVWQYQNVTSTASKWIIATQQRFDKINAITTVVELPIDLQDRNRTLNKTRSKIQNIHQREEIININDSGIVTPESSLIYGIYIDYRPTPALVHIMMFRKCFTDSVFSMELILHFLHEADISLRNFALKSECSTRFAPECHWLQHDVYFKISSNLSSNATLTGATLIGKQDKLLKVPASRIRTISRAVTPDILLAVCVAPLYLTADWFRLVQFVEIWRSQGAQKILIYYQSVSATVMSFLRAYQTEGIVEIVPWSLLPTSKTGNFDPNTDLFRGGQPLAENDCMYRTMELAKFVAKVDLDEFIIPHSGTLIEFLEQTLQKQPNIGLMIFQPHSLIFAEHPLRNSNHLINLKEINFTYLASSIHDYKMSLSRAAPKTVILPHRTKKVGVHAAELLAGYVAIHNAAGAAYVHERYDLRKPDRLIINSSYPLSAITAANIQKKYDSLVENYFGEKQEIPTDSNILLAVGPCLLQYRARHICRSTMICYDTVRNMTDWEFVTESSFFVF